MLRHENHSAAEIGIARVVHDADLPTYDARTTTEALALFTRFREGGLCSAKIVALIYGPAGFETVVGCGPLLVVSEFALPELGERPNVCARRSAVHEGKHFVDLEIEDVSWIVELVNGMQPAPELEKDA